jgi:hypothetical protein
MKRRDILKSIASTGLITILESCTSEERTPNPQALTPSASGAPPKANAEVEAKLNNVIQRYGDRMSSDEEIKMLRMSLTYQQKLLDIVRAYHLENWDAPASVLQADIDSASLNASLEEFQARK